MTTRTKSRTGGTDDRRSRGRQREGASFPVGPSTSQLPPDYTTAFAEIKERIRKGRLSAVLVANAGLVLLYWDIGRAILDRQGREGWGAKVIDRLSQDLRDVYPDMQGLSPRNLKYMRALAAAWPDRGIVQRTVAQIPWRSNVTLLDKVKDAHTRLWYAQRVREEGWSRDVLAVQIESRLHERAGKTITNFPETLPPEESDLATQVFKDPYLFDFLGAAASRTEREIEQALVDHVQRFLLELGAGFAFVGRRADGCCGMGDPPGRIAAGRAAGQPAERRRNRGGAQRIRRYGCLRTEPLSSYDRYVRWYPAREADLLDAPEFLMTALLDAPGRYRRGGVAVMGQGRVHHVGPPAERVPVLMADLLAWLGSTREHPLILHALGLSDRKSLRQCYLLPALQRGYVEMTRPDVPNARNQRYLLTALGRHVRSSAQ